MKLKEPNWGHELYQTVTLHEQSWSIVLKALLEYGTSANRTVKAVIAYMLLSKYNINKIGPAYAGPYLKGD